MRFTSILQEKESEASAYMKRKKVLVVDDFVNFRITMRNMLATLGVEHPDEAYNGEDAVRKMATKRFDVVFCDYNLGAGKDGQQVMEEARERHLIGYSTIFMMVTAENTIDMIMGVAEYEPDDYLVKPFTKQTLEKKIITIFEKKETLKDIIKAMDELDYPKALILCDEKIAGTPKHLAELFRLKGEILIRSGDYVKAEQYFKEIATKGKFPWTMLGIGKCRFMSGDYEKAQYIFEELLRTNDKIMAAYDWLTKTQEKLGNNQDAQRTLMKAVALSPKALLRQKELGDLAHRNGDQIGRAHV
jgi:CheY-like chemotaxis protein